MSHEDTSLTTDLNKSGGFTGGENTGAVAFAGVLLIMVGLFHALQGLVALLSDDIYLRGENYVFHFSFTTWGWIHLIMGVILFLARVAVEAGVLQGWERYTGAFGAVVGIENRFGASAPLKVVTEKLGFTAANVAAKAAEVVAALPARLQAAGLRPA